MLQTIFVGLIAVQFTIINVLNLMKHIEFKKIKKESEPVVIKKKKVIPDFGNPLKPYKTKEYEYSDYKSKNGLYQPVLPEGDD